MGGVPTPLAYLLLCWGTVTAVLLVLVINENTLSIREDTELYLNKAENEMMAAEQKVLVAKTDGIGSGVMNFKTDTPTPRAVNEQDRSRERQREETIETLRAGNTNNRQCMRC